MAHSAASQLYDDTGFIGATGTVSAGPISAGGGASFGDAGMHLSLLAVLTFLIILWAIVRVAGFRFVVTTGVGR